MSQRMVTIYNSEGVVMKALWVNETTKQVVFPVRDGGQVKVDIDARDRVFFPLHCRTVCLGHA